MSTLADLLKDIMCRTAVVAAALFCAPVVCHAAVMDFPGGSLSAPSSVGLDDPSVHGLTATDLAVDGTASAAIEDPNLLPGLAPEAASQESADDIVDSVLGVSQSGNWLDETREAERSQSLSALSLIRAYVNIINQSTRPSAVGDTAPSRDNGQGFVMTMARGFDDQETLNLITQVLQPHVENELVLFSVLGFGRFMLIGEPDSGNLSVMDLSNGKRLDFQSGSSDPAAEAAPSQPLQDSGGFIPNEEETLAQLLLLVFAVVTDPLFLLTSACILSIWLLYRLAKRFG